MTLMHIARLLKAGGIDADAWQAEAEMRAEKVALFRAYYEGDHRANLTDEMSKLLRVSNQNTLATFNTNHMRVIVDTMADRLKVDTIAVDAEAVNEWTVGVLRANRFDGLQDDVDRAVCRDGDTFLLAGFDSERKRVKWTHEPAYDGLGGMLAVYDEPGRLACAVKVWTTTKEKIGDTIRVNLYWPDRIEKYVGTSTSTLTPYQDDGEEWPLRWVDRTGQPLGIPVLHFRNRGAEYNDYGMSELEDAIPLQDALNRTLYSMVMTAEYGAFPIRTAIGVKPPTAITPGTWIGVYPKSANGVTLEPTKEELELYKVVRFDTLPAADLRSYIETAGWIEEQIYAVTNTPRTVGDAAASGESQKQREIKLLGKVRALQAKLGNVWEDALAISRKLQTTFSDVVVPEAAFSTIWRTAELRDERMIIENAEKVREFIPLREYYRIVAPVFGWDEAKIDQMVAEMAQADQQRLDGVRALLPVTGNLDLPGIRQGA